MANTVTALSYANTFGDWVIATNSLVVENNNLAKQNYTKDSGTLFLNDTNIGLQVANVAIIGGQLQVQGVGSSGYIQNNLRVDGQTYLQNTSLSLTTLGQANIGGPLLALAPNTGLTVANNTHLQGNLRVNSISTFFSNVDISGATTIANTVNVSGAAIFQSNIAAQQYINTTYDVYARNFYGSGTAKFGGSITADGAATFNNGAVIYGQLTVDGNFITLGRQINSTNNFVLNSNNTVGVTSKFSVYRGPSSANGELRWNEPSQYWDIPDVNNPDANTSYSKILTANLISDSIISNSSSRIASSNSVNALNILLTTQINTLNTTTTSNFNEANTRLTNQLNDLETTLTTTINTRVAAAYGRANTSSNTFVGTSGTAIANTGVIRFLGTFGVTATAQSNTINIATPQDLRTSATPAFAGLALASPLAISEGGTGGNSKEDALRNLLPSGTSAGYVLATGGPGVYYWAAGGTGSGGGTQPGTRISSLRNNYVATNNSQTVYTTPTYTPGTGQLRIYINGVRQSASEYNETDGNTVTLLTATTAGDIILCEVDGYVSYAYYANNIPFTSPFGGIPESANTIQLAIESVEARKATIISPEFSGIVRAPTPPVNASNTQVATTKFVKDVLNQSNTWAISITGNAATATNAGYATNAGDAQRASLATYVSATQQANVITGKTSSLAMVKDNTTDTGSFVCRATGTGDTNLAGITYSNDSYSIKQGVRADGFFGLGGASSNAWTWYVSSAGNMTAAGGVTAYSDPALKDVTGRITNATQKIQQITGVNFTWKEGIEHTQMLAGRKDIGVLADQVEKVLPEIVHKSVSIDGKSYRTVSYEKLIPVLIESIKELKAEIEELKGKIK